ncbi:MAG: hypothetical protein ACRCZK_01680 [Oscillospiraceae bacterium]
MGNEQLAALPLDSYELKTPKVKAKEVIADDTTTVDTREDKKL